MSAPNPTWPPSAQQSFSAALKIDTYLKRYFTYFMKEALAIRVKRKLYSTDVVDALTNLFILRGPPEFIRSDNGAEFIAKNVRAWIGAVGAKTTFIAPGFLWENG